MHHHRELCARAVDPLEIAAALEAHGLTDRGAARYRHRDVFSLAEEMFARVPRAAERRPGEPGGPDGPGPATPASPARAGAARGAAVAARVLLPVLPGALCAATLAAPDRLPPDRPHLRLAVAVLGGLAALLALHLALRPALRGASRTGLTLLWACWLSGYALYGDGLLAGLLNGAPRSGGAAPALAPPSVPLALALAVAPICWGAWFFAARARRTLGTSRSLGEFASRVRPVLVLTVLLVAGALYGVQAAAGQALSVWRGVPPPPPATQAATVALATLFFAALLLLAHGFPRAASAGTGAACVLHAAALGAVLAGRGGSAAGTGGSASAGGGPAPLPGAGPLARPVAEAVAAHGPSVVPAAACAAAALGLLAYAFRALTGASAHHGRDTHDRGAGRRRGG
ncbi:hypothetical protein [Streptomyces sp. JJ36]|uniref:hypothetical protein n=1 Tax=Streptomyces sp. JJ36 TaxID=2736645 RepID=UPI001F1E8651|nr:hypothetical protein [Streptomyces sp. JJ36]MCF6526430.1 hypothetical protein [Streptomyces sp. JJ36]